jgi:hypothetical protein
VQYFCDGCDTRLWALESQQCGVCAECRMGDDCEAMDLEDMLEEVLNDHNVNG